MTTKQKHTPGPWRSWYTGRGNSVFFHVSATVPAVPGFCGPTEKQIAQISPTDGTSEQANARLIAASPELLEALKDAVCALQCSGKDWPAETKARAAIAKATGETP